MMAKGKGGGDGGHYKYRKLALDYPQWVKYLDSDTAPDANEVYRKALAGAPDKSVVICSIGFITNLRRLLGAARVGTGRFGAEMKVRLLNDGPFSVELLAD